MDQESIARRLGSFAMIFVKLVRGLWLVEIDPE
jgi:hypothetical protein